MSYEDCLKTEKEGNEIFRPLLESISTSPLIWTSSRYDQNNLGDVIADLINIELKTERKWTGNLFFEVWSDLNETEGWIYKLGKCDVFLYLFLDKMKCYGFPFKETIEWYKYKNNMKRFPLVPQNKHVQENDTWGRLIPIDVLLDETRMIDIPLNGEFEKSWRKLC